MKINAILLFITSLISMSSIALANGKLCSKSKILKVGDEFTGFPQEQEVDSNRFGSETYPVYLLSSYNCGVMTLLIIIPDSKTGKEFIKDVLSIKVNRENFYKVCFQNKKGKREQDETIFGISKTKPGVDWITLEKKWKLDKDALKFVEIKNVRIDCADRLNLMDM
ncbi:MAG TPA: hypothetical protein VE954_21865 [Oligoflexus sp.]|uniref:hypothetical protein n=1 Tax=Oligoflexus sp. TaxID=1971216 RepID=UPI002D3637D0|nr:hypothetical protein [Oligoflexus sp.]HYX35753.1 hypothetical protein [Oligoflexus sp.]